MLKKVKMVWLMTLLAVISMQGHLFAEQTPTQLNEYVKQIALFKNGFGYFVSRVDVPAGIDSFVFNPVENASLGTFWAAYPQSLQLKSMVADEVELAKDRQVANLVELLIANDGKKVRVWLDDKEIEGELVVIGEEPEFAPIKSRSRKSIMPQPVILVETVEGTTAIKGHQIKSVTFLDDKVNYNAIEKDKAWRIDVDIENNSADSYMDFSYLAKGITWSPSYLIDISDDKNATLTAKAMILNDIADFEDVKLHLVTGFPHLQFADVNSPFTTKYSVQSFLNSLAGDQPQYSRHSQKVFSNVASFEADAGFAAPDYGKASKGVVNEDLFFYPLGNVTLKKNQTGYFPLFSEKVPYKHIYIWNVSANDHDTWQSRYQNRPGTQEKQQVWHCLKLENKTNQPWTTAPAQTAKKGMVLGQDTLDFTPAGDDATLKITLAMDVRAEYLEYETERQRNAANFHGSRYDLVTIEGKLSVKNFKNKTVTMEINKTITGDFLNASPEPDVKNMPKEVGKLNVTRKLTWTLDLDEGESEEITYTYKMYVRS